MRNILKVTATSAIFLLLTACAGLDGGPLVRPGMPTGTIEIVNGSSRNVNAIVMSECSNSTYGFNRLSNGNYIPPGRSMRFTVTAGCWDVGAGVIGFGDAMQRMNVRVGGLSRYTVN